MHSTQRRGRSRRGDGLRQGGLAGEDRRDVEGQGIDLVVQEGLGGLNVANALRLGSEIAMNGFKVVFTVRDGHP